MGGYGVVYLKALLNRENAEGMHLVAAADRAPERCELLADVQALNVPVYPTMEELLANHRPDLVVLSTPPQYHAEQVILALEHGCHVLTEKPVASDPQQVQQMIQARDKAGKMVAVGYQWSFSPAILKLKSDLISGRFGKARRLRTSVFWPRDERYFSRNDWAGRKRDSAGRLVLDSPVNNACSHFLHNMFFVLGKTIDQSDSPSQVQAELYRANKIDNYDTAAIRCITHGGAELVFLTSHATQWVQEPLIHYEFERANIRYGGEEGGELIAHLPDGTSLRYGAPLDAGNDYKLRDVCRCIRQNKPVACGLEAAASQNTCMFAAQQSMPDIIEFPKSLITIEGEPGNRTTYLAALQGELSKCYQSYKLPSELNFDWARPGKIITDL
jgi:predicted dehydrogenase